MHIRSYCTLTPVTPWSGVTSPTYASYATKSTTPLKIPNPQLDSPFLEIGLHRFLQLAQNRNVVTNERR